MTGKYRNQKTIYKGIPFDSQKEKRRYQELERMEKDGLIHRIETQPRYDLIVNGDKICTYRADFRYEEVKTKRVIVEDVKSTATITPVYRLKKKLMWALYRIEIIEVL